MYLVLLLFDNGEKIRLCPKVGTFNIAPNDRLICVDPSNRLRLGHIWILVIHYGMDYSGCVIVFSRRAERSISFKYFCLSVWVQEYRPAMAVWWGQGPVGLLEKQ